MFVKQFFIFACLGFILSIPTHAASLITQLNAISTFQTSFTQQSLSDQGKVLTESTGSFAFQKPSRFRWETKKPQKHLVISDGTVVYEYDPELLQAIRRKHEHVRAASPMLLIAEKPDGLLAHFTIQDTPKCKSASGCYHLLSKDGTQPEWQIRFQGNTLLELEFIDALSQRNVIRFHQTTQNAPCNPGLFDFHPPKDVEVIDND